MNKQLSQVMINVKEAAVKTNLTEAHIRHLIRVGEIEAVKVGKEYRISLEVLNRYLGIQTDMTSLEKEMRIKELEAEVKRYQFIFRTIQSNISNLNNVLMEE